MLISSAFLPLFFLPLCADEKQATERNVDFLAPFWHRFGFSSFIPGVALWFAPRTFPGITADTGKKGDFCHGFDMVLTEREGADLPPPCHVFALDTIAVLLPHVCPPFLACYSPVIRRSQAYKKEACTRLRVTMSDYHRSSNGVSFMLPSIIAVASLLANACLS